MAVLRPQRVLRTLAFSPGAQRKVLLSRLGDRVVYLPVEQSSKNHELELNVVLKPAYLKRAGGRYVVGFTEYELAKTWTSTSGDSYELTSLFVADLALVLSPHCGLSLNPGSRLELLLQALDLEQIAKTSLVELQPKSRPVDGSAHEDSDLALGGDNLLYLGGTRVAFAAPHKRLPALVRLRRPGLIKTFVRTLSSERAVGFW